MTFRIALLALLLFPAHAFAQAHCSYTLVEPQVPVGDLASCELLVTVGSQQHAETFPASDPSGGGSHAFNICTGTSLVLEGPVGTAGTCVDTAGNVSAVGVGPSNSFPDIAPPAPSISHSP